jgi:hypothetical protein
MKFGSFSSELKQNSANLAKEDVSIKKMKTCFGNPNKNLSCTG